MGTPPSFQYQGHVAGNGPDELRPGSGVRQLLMIYQELGSNATVFLTSAPTVIYNPQDTDAQLTHHPAAEHDYPQNHKMEPNLEDCVGTETEGADRRQACIDTATVH